jgi:hypothetical protein
MSHGIKTCFMTLTAILGLSASAASGQVAPRPGVTAAQPVIATMHAPAPQTVANRVRFTLEGQSVMAKDVVVPNLAITAPSSTTPQNGRGGTHPASAVVITLKGLAASSLQTVMRWENIGSEQHAGSAGGGGGALGGGSATLEILAANGSVATRYTLNHAFVQSISNNLGAGDAGGTATVTIQAAQIIKQ